MRGLILLFFVLLWVPLLGSPVLETAPLPLSDHTSEIRRVHNVGSASQVCFFQVNAEETEESEENERDFPLSGLGLGQSRFQNLNFLFAIAIPTGKPKGGWPVARPSAQILYCIFRL